MIEIENASRWRAGDRYDRTAVLLIGVVAILAATFAIQQAHFGLAGSRAQVEAGRLSVDAATKIATSSLAQDGFLVAQQQAAVLGMDGIGRQLAGTTAGDDGFVAIGAAQQAASTDLRNLLARIQATSGKAPLDPYAADLVGVSAVQIGQEVAEQNRQVDIANDMGARQSSAVLGLSLVTLAGVLAGVAAVLGGGRAGWGVLVVGWGVAAVSALVAVGVLV